MVNQTEAATVRRIFRRYMELGSVYALHAELERDGIRTKVIRTRNGIRGACAFGRGNLAHLLQNRIYIGEIVHKGTSYPGLHEPIVDRETFEAVQVMMTERRMGSRERTLERAPLTGILFDALGNRMAPTHARGRGGKRYLYYISPVARSDGDAARVLRRVPSSSLEELIIERLRSWTARPNAGWTDLLPFIRRVELHPEAIVADLARPAHERWTTSEDEACEVLSDGALRITSPVRVFIRRGRTSRIEGSAGSGRCRPERSLIAGLRRAHTELANCGIDLMDSKSTIEEARGVGDPYLRKLAGLAFLAPDIQRAILQGRQPAGLRLADLLSRNMPLCWKEQRKLVGMT